MENSYLSKLSKDERGWIMRLAERNSFIERNNSNTPHLGSRGMAQTEEGAVNIEEEVSRNSPNGGEEVQGESPFLHDQNIPTIHHAPQVLSYINTLGCTTYCW